MRRLLPLFTILCAAPVFAAEFDWPQWRGPDRTSLSKEKGLLKEWPAEGPKLAWKITGLGDGYSTPSISEGKIYLVGTKEANQTKDEYVICLNEKDGSRVWDRAIGKSGDPGVYPGPRSTPTIDNGYAYVVSSDGNFVCLEIAKGEIKWKKNYKSDFAGSHGRWNYAESPLVDGDLVIGTPGSDDAALVAFKKASGEIVWKTSVKGVDRKPTVDAKGGKKRASGNYGRAGYSSAIVATIHDVKQYVQFIDGGVIGVNAADGKLLWHYEEPANTVANISTPIVEGDLVFAGSAYGTGSGQAKIVKYGAEFKAEQTYFIKELKNHHGGLVLVDGHVYGTGDLLTCVNFKTGKIAWSDRSAGKGSVTYADGHLYVRGEGGKIALVEANPEKYVEKGMFSQPERSKFAAWPHPVISKGKMYIRDADLLLCYDVKSK